MMNWNKLDHINLLEVIKEESKQQAVVIFKHSTSCSISAMALNRLERSWQEEEMTAVKPYYLDLIANRAISNAIVENFGIMHQSPQLLVVKDGTCVYNDSHMGINYQTLKAEIGN